MITLVPGDKRKAPVSGLNQVIGMVIRRLEGCDLSFQAKFVWTSWHGEHEQAIVRTF